MYYELFLEMGNKTKFLGGEEHTPLDVGGSVVTPERRNKKETKLEIITSELPQVAMEKYGTYDQEATR